MNTALNLCKNEWVYFQVSNPTVLKLQGEDAGSLIHRLSTNAVQQLSNGQGTLTVLVTEKGRIIDCVSYSVVDSAIYLVGSEGKAAELIRWIKKYVIMEDVKISNISESCSPLIVTGPHAAALMEHYAPKTDLNNVAVGAAITLSDGSLAIRYPALVETTWVLLGNEKSSIVGDIRADEARDATDTYDVVRIHAGWGKSGHEWTDQFNPLEAGLVGWVDFTKGCYIGQEIVARLDSYDKVKHRLMGFTSPTAAEGNVVLDGKPIGFVTSCVPFDDGFLGMALVRTAHAVHQKSLETEGGPIDLRMLPMEFA